MTQSKHTPGPWSLPHFARPEVNCECGYVLTDGYMGAVAKVFCSGEGEDWIKNGDNPKFDEAVANAKLIAAAPELLSLAALPVVHEIEESEGIIRLSLNGVEVCAHQDGTPQATALLQFDAEQRAIISKATS